MGIIRLLLAFSVLVAHSPLTGRIMVGGELAVQMFFVISGFYMAMILNTQYRKRTGAFFQNRFLRLYPLYLSSVLIIGAAGFFFKQYLGMDVSSWDSIPKALDGKLIPPPLGGALFFSNFSMLFQDLTLFLKVNSGVVSWGHYGDSVPPLHTFLLIPQAWSLSLEVVFYAIAPCIVRNKKTILVWILSSVLLRVLGHGVLGWSGDPFSYRFFPFEIATFLLGSLSWHFYQQYKLGFLTRNITPIKITLVATLVLWPWILQFNDISKIFYLAAFALIVPYLFEHSKDDRRDTWIGDLSYPFYLVHVFVLAVTTVVFTALVPGGGLGVDHKVMMVVVASTATFLLSFALNAFVQRPIETLRKSLRMGQKGRGENPG